MISDTIVAPATPYGIGGIAVVRLSGAQSLFIANKLINNNGLNVKLTPRFATLVNIQEESGSTIDESLLTFFKAPNSYTGEDLIEISCHGNPIIVDRIISSCCNFGARIAEPGEFTRRAFVNGKMDLVQAESVASLIHSQSAESARLNLRLLHGELSGKLNDLRKKLINVVSLVEFELDISEEELQPNFNNQMLSVITKLNEQIRKLLGSYKQAHMLNHGALVVIAGPPNAGKSTLLNTLSETDRAITSSIPGTTRDAINVQLILDGVPISLVDTAGIRRATEELEKEGVNRTFKYLQRADLIIAVHSPGLVEVPLKDYPDDIPVIKIINKIDLLSVPEFKSITNLYSESLAISAKTGYNIALLKQQIKTSLGISGSLSETVTITTSRQQRSLNICFDKLNAALNLLNNPRCAYELVAIELHDALDAIDVIMGKTTPDDILNNIFNQFCVGK